MGNLYVRQRRREPRELKKKGESESFSRLSEKRIVCSAKKERKKTTRGLCGQAWKKETSGRGRPGLAAKRKKGKKGAFRS